MSATTTPLVGLAMVLNRNSGTHGSPTWGPVPNCQDLSMDPGTADEVDVPTRGSFGYHQYLQGLKAAAYEWDMLWKQSDADITAIMNAWLAGSLIEFAFSDGAIATSGTTYWRQECTIFSIKREEPLGDAVKIHVVAKPCYSTNAPAYTSVA